MKTSNRTVIEINADTKKALALCKQRQDLLAALGKLDDLAGEYLADIQCRECVSEKGKAFIRGMILRKDSSEKWDSIQKMAFAAVVSAHGQSGRKGAA